MPRTKAAPQPNTKGDSPRNNGKGAAAAAPPTPPAANAPVETKLLPLREVKASPYQPRESVGVDMPALANSLASQGQLYPVLVRPVKGGFELIDGHRRHAALVSLKAETVRAEVRVMTDEEAATRVFESNVQRKDFSPLERARFLQRYIADFNVTQETAGKRFGMAQETVSNYLRVLEAPREVLDLLDEGKITVAHVKALLPLQEKPEAMVKVAQYAAKGRDGEPVPVRDIGWQIENEQEKMRRSVEGKKERENNNELREKLAERLLKGLTRVEGKGKARYTDPDSGLPIIFGRVKVKNPGGYGSKVLKIIEPSFVGDSNPFNPGKDAALVKELDKMGIVWQKASRNDERAELVEYVGGNRYYSEATFPALFPSPKLRGVLGGKQSGPCPCGGEHVAVRGWELTKGDPLTMRTDWGYATNTSPAPSTVVYCSEPAKVLLACAKKVKVLHEKRTAKRDAIIKAFDTFIADVAPKGGPEVIAFLVGVNRVDGGGKARVKDALKHPAKFWQEYCHKEGADFVRYGSRGDGEDDALSGLGKVLALIGGAPDEEPEPEPEPEPDNEAEKGEAADGATEEAAAPQPDADAAA